jgi:hypothetical protein
MRSLSRREFLRNSTKASAGAAAALAESVGYIRGVLAELTR